MQIITYLIIHRRAFLQIFPTTYSVSVILVISQLLAPQLYMQARPYRTTVISPKELAFIFGTNSVSISFLIFYVNQKLFYMVFILD